MRDLVLKGSERVDIVEGGGHPKPAMMAPTEILERELWI
jgi:hypothetical protein